MLKAIHRVFVSSTYEDLREERSEVQKALLKLNCFPVGMEIFPSADDETWEFIKRQIAESDYYLVIVGGRYGSLAPDGVSFTEKEYDFARTIKKPSIGFVRGDLENVPAKFIETDPLIRIKLDTFRRKVQTHPVRLYASPHQLATEVMASVVDLRERHPVPGFVRVDEVADPKKYADLLEENAYLKSQISSAKQVLPFDGAGEEFALTVKVKSKEQQTTSDLERKFPLAKIFQAFADALLSGRVYEYAINDAAKEIFFGDVDDASRIRQCEDLLRRFFGLGLLEYEQQGFDSLMGSQMRTAWRLTDVGREQYGLLKYGTPFC